MLNGSSEGATKKHNCKFYFDGAVFGNGVLVSSHFIPISVKLLFSCKNNMTEYEACIIGLQAALDLNIRDVDVYGDSTLIICQAAGEWRTKDPRLVPYHRYLEELILRFRRITFRLYAQDKESVR
jgi:ribonuclease HI